MGTATPPPTPPGGDLERRATELARRAERPARCGNVLFGIASWTERSLVRSGLFYPKGTNDAAGRLRHYASHFPIVEVDATYYSLLPPEMAHRWVENTPSGFRFDVKAHPIVTGHPIDTRRLPGDLAERVSEAGLRGPRVYGSRLPADLAREIEDRFFALVVPLAEAGKLGCVMVQFPPWFKATRGNARRLELLRQRHGGTPMSVEFRHASWLATERRDRVFDLLRSNGFSYVGVDEPDVATGGVPPVVEVTNPDLALVRLHGQNARGWHRGASVHERFDYLYSPEELSRWVGPVRRLSDEARSVHVVFNNCVRNHAVVNAKGLAVLLNEPG